MTTYRNIGSELLWANSMPCLVGSDAEIPVAQYGSSNRAKMKTIYRVGLGHRYGRVMQTVAGLHFNFSLPTTLWAFLHLHENSIEDLREYTTRRYFDLIRNFRRNYWLLIYLFGASPAVCKTFVHGRSNQLQELDKHTLYLPYATSLRMGDLGYQSKAQENLFVCYNSRLSYVNTLVNAIREPYGPYRDIQSDDPAMPAQLNDSLLQIENEFYSAIRPKRTAQAGETALTALCRRGVEYIEVRCLDIDPFEPLGVSESSIRFLDIFLVYCTLKDSPKCGMNEFKIIQENQKTVVNRGREPGLQLQSMDGSPRSLMQWGKDLMQAMQPVAELLDNAYQGSENIYQQALAEQAEKVRDSNLTPSAKVLQQLQSQSLSFGQWALIKSTEYKEAMNQKRISPALEKRLGDMAEESLALQKSEEEMEQEPFSEYLERYYSQYNSCCS